MLNFNSKNFSSLKIYEFFCEEKILNDVLFKIKKMEYVNNMFNHTSLEGINDLEDFKNLHDWFQSCIDSVFLDLNLPESFKKIILTESWVNRSNRNEGHHSHHHPNSYLSAIFYLTSNFSGYTKFESKNMWYENEHLFDAYEDMCGFNKYNVFSEKPEAGKLLIFPSKLKHHVEPNFSDDVRYTISFNAYPEIHHKNRSSYLKIKVIPYSKNNLEIEE